MIDLVEEALAAMVSDSSRHVRETAMAAMDRVRAKRSHEQFKAFLKKGTKQEKIHVVYAAGEMGGSEGVALLLDALSDKDEEVRGIAVRALLPFPTMAVLKTLWEMLPREKGVVLGNIVEVLGASGRKELAPHIVRYLSHPETEVRAKAIIAVSRLADDDGWKKIMALRGDPDQTIRAAVAEGLGNWTSAQP
ncbi:MAG: HEAT repeat domain-containing protein [Syntrophorhabdaceae bacterium]|nr:HEAT repeat domain-containing protein [Syntrophorhabdaceae bacterium]